jgi:hypothetical protein
LKPHFAYTLLRLLPRSFFAIAPFFHSPFGPLSARPADLPIKRMVIISLSYFSRFHLRHDDLFTFLLLDSWLDAVPSVWLK